MDHKQNGKWLRRGIALVSSTIMVGAVFAACSSSDNSGGNSMTDGGNDATSGKDSSGDVTNPTPESGADSNPGPDGTADATPDVVTKADADSGPSLVSLALCPLMNQAYACGGNGSIPAGMCVEAPDSGSADIQSEIGGTWAFDVAQDFGANLYNDCRTQNLAVAISNDVDTGTDYQNAVNVWVTQLFGCSIALDAGALTYGLLPPEPEQAGQIWTKADLAALNEIFVLSVEQTLDGSGSAQQNGLPAPNTLTGGAPFTLTAQQLSDLKSNLALLAAGVSGVNSSTTHYSFAVDPDAGATCEVPDGG
jgi:hypothetical protein